MANITVTTSQPNVTVSSTTNTVNVSTTTSNVIVSNVASISNSDIRAAISVTDAGGDGSLAYNSTSGVITYTGPSASEVRAHFSNTSPVTYDSSTGVIGIDSAALFTGKTTDDLTEGSTNLYFTDARANAVIATNTTDNLAEGSTNLYYTDARVNNVIANYTGNLSVAEISVSGNANVTKTVFANAIHTTHIDTNPGLTGDANITIDDGSGPGGVPSRRVVIHPQGAPTVKTTSEEGVDLGDRFKRFKNINGDRHIARDLVGSNTTIGIASINTIGNVNIQSANLDASYQLANLEIKGFIEDANNSSVWQTYGNPKLGFRESTPPGEGATGARVAEVMWNNSASIDGSSHYLWFGQNHLLPLQGNAGLQYRYSIGQNGRAYHNSQIIGVKSNRLFIGNSSTLAGNTTVAGGTGSQRAAVIYSEESDTTPRLKLGYSDTDWLTSNITLTTNTYGELVDTKGDFTIDGETGFTAGNIVLLKGQTVGGDFQFRIDNSYNPSIQDSVLKYDPGIPGWQIIRPDGTGGDIITDDLLTSNLNPLVHTWTSSDFTQDYKLLTISDTSALGTSGPQSNIIIAHSYETSSALTDFEMTRTNMQGLPNNVSGGSNKLYIYAGAAKDADGSLEHYNHLDVDGSVRGYANVYAQTGGIEANLDITSANGNISGVGMVTTGNATVGGDMNVAGNLEVTGNINYREVEDLLVQDQTITLNFGNASAQTSQIIVDRSGSSVSNVALKWNETDDKWQFTNDGSTFYNLATSTDDLAEGSTNLYYTDARANTAINAKALAGITESYSSTDTNVFKVDGDGYALFGGNRLSGNSSITTYSGASDLKFFEFEGSTTTGDANITVSAIRQGDDDSAATVADLAVGYTLLGGTTIFADDAYVTAIDTGTGNVTMSSNAISTQTLTYSAGNTFTPGLVDTSTGLVMNILSTLQSTGSGSYTTVASQRRLNIKYGYPQRGPQGTDFDIAAVGSPSDYSFADLTDFTVARTNLTPANTVIKANNGIVVGPNTDLTNRGENDVFPSFGVNIMWDGLTDTGTEPIQPAMLFKSYTDNASQSSVGQLSSGAPRLFFTTANGKSTDNALTTYPRSNQELGRLTFWGSTGTLVNPSSYNVPAYMSVGAADDWDTWGGGVGGNTNVYFGATGNGVTADTYLSYKEGEVFIGSNKDAKKPITFLPAAQVSGTNPSTAYPGADTTWANINYANTTAPSGAKFTITNGGSVDAGTVGDMQVSMKRLDNSSNQNNALSSIFSGSLVTPFWADRIILALPDAVGTTLNGVSGTMSASGTIDTTSTGNETALGGNTYDLLFAFDGGTYQGYFIQSGGSIVTYSSIGGTDPGAVAVQTSGAQITTVVSSGVTAKEWKFNLAEQSNNLALQSEAVTKVEFSDDVSIFSNRVRFQNLTTTEINALTGMSAGDTVYNTTVATLCFYNGSSWQKVNHANL